MSVPEQSLAALLREQAETNRLLRVLSEILLDSGPLYQPLRRKVPLQTVNLASGRTIAAGDRIVPIDKTGVDVAFWFAQSTMNSNQVRHRLTSRSGEGSVFDFNATQQELTVVGLTSPAVNGLWTPAAGPDAAGNYTVMFTPAFPVTLHEIFKLEFFNESSPAAEVTISRLFVAWYEWSKDLSKILENAGVIAGRP